MAVPGVALLIPKFLVLNTFGLFDTYTGMILPLLVDAAGIFIMKQFFESIPVKWRKPPGWTVRASSGSSGRWYCPWRDPRSSP